VKVFGEAVIAGFAKKHPASRKPLQRFVTIARTRYARIFPQSKRRSRQRMTHGPPARWFSTSAETNTDSSGASISRKSCWRSRPFDPSRTRPRGLV